MRGWRTTLPKAFAVAATGGIQKSDSATLLAGHRAGPGFPGFMVDDTWSFKGSS